jgi:hypothetical protein
MSVGETVYSSWSVLLCSGYPPVGESEGSGSRVEAGETVSARGVAGDLEEYAESRDAGASWRKLQSSPFLSQFAQDGCFASHYSIVSVGH